MSEFQALPADNAPAAQQTPPVPPKKESLLTRPLFLGQSLPWLAGGTLVLLFAGWFLFSPSSSTSNAEQLAFGDNTGFGAEPSPRAAVAQLQTAEPLQSGGLSVPVSALSAPETGAAVPDEVVKLIREGQEFQKANREAITRLSDTVRAQSAALTGLQQRLDGLASDNKRLANQLTVLEARQTPAAGNVSTGKPARRTALSGMKLESVQDGMAWIRWQGRTWAVQSGDSLGGLTVREVNTAERSVATSAGVLH